MANQLSGLDGHHFSLRSILKNPSTSYDAESAGLQSISLTREMNLQPAALKCSLTPSLPPVFGSASLARIHMPIAPTALTVLGGLPASRAPDMLCRIDSSTTFTLSFI